jgi:uncharacterized SAM-binding protein YcdF (DUF218 family)
MFTLISVIKTLILPPGILIILLILGLLLWRVHSYVGAGIIIFTIVIFYFLSVQPVALLLAKPLQRYPALTVDNLKNPQAQAIVALGAGRYENAPEYGKDTSSANELVRDRYAAYLYRKTKLPVMTSGGYVFGQRSSEGQIMADVLQEDLNVPVKWIDNIADNTWQEAKVCSGILKKDGVDTIYLVTHTLHMPRSVYIFKHFGLKVIPAPTYFITKNTEPTILDWLPNMGDLQTSQFCLHEYLGLAWYWLKVWSSTTHRLHHSG